ncbi:ras GEF [Microstroma glucosiphilum]|uniref:Ras GEF n=1 Tax=Pseudomicrostroma glucosiphilum TaxID=1684307 RepID=A0A316UEE4_9BASI|nr:ras GEF [Pseudomicrostroma glucosiphilum]PWN23572.1 ras GEF [Pseudomicrostroma glucosiphilum]
MSVLGRGGSGIGAMGNVEDEGQSQNFSPSSSVASMVRSDSQTSPLSSSSSSRNASPKIRRRPSALAFWQRQDGPEASPLTGVPEGNQDVSPPFAYGEQCGAESSASVGPRYKKQPKPWNLGSGPDASSPSRKDASQLSAPWSSDSDDPDAGGVRSYGDGFEQTTSSLRDLGVGTSASTKRASVGARSSRSLQGSPPRRQSGSISMATTLSHAPLRRLASGDSGEDQSFYDAADDETGDDDDDTDEEDDQDVGEVNRQGVPEGRKSKRRSRAGLMKASNDNDAAEISPTAAALASVNVFQQGTQSVAWSASAVRRDGEDGLSDHPQPSTLRQDGFAPGTLHQNDNPGTAAGLAQASGPSLSISSSNWLAGSPHGTPFAPSLFPSPDPLSAAPAIQPLVPSRVEDLPPARSLPDGPLPLTPAYKNAVGSEAASPSSTVDESSFASSFSGTASLSGASRAEEPAPLINQRRRSVASTSVALPPLLHSATSPVPVVSSPSSSVQIPPIRGRARGYTVGAVPASGRYPPFVGRVYIQHPGPRSGLSREVVPEADVPATSSLAQDDNKDNPEGSLAASNSLPTDLNLASVPSAASLIESNDVAAAAGHRDVSHLRRASHANGSMLDKEARGVGNASVNDSPTAGSASQTLAPPVISSASMPTGRSRSGSTASILLQQVQHPPRSHASFVIAVIGHKGCGKSTVVRKGLKQFGLSRPQVLSEKVTSHSTLCVVNQEQRSIEVLEIDTSVLLTKKAPTLDGNTESESSEPVFAWPPYLPHMDAVVLCYDAAAEKSFTGMSNLLEAFARTQLSIVMLACKSDLYPKVIDPYDASDLAAVHGVGLAECTARSDEGKKRMRDCFSYLVKEVAKVRSARLRKSRGSTTTGPNVASPAADSATDSNPSSPVAGQRVSEGDQNYFGRTRSISPNRSGSEVEDARTPSIQGSPPASGWDSGASSSSRDRRLSLTGAPGQLPRRPSAAVGGTGAIPGGISSRGASDNSDVPSSFGGEQSEEDGFLRGNARIQHIKSAGGYVTLEELWDKLFFAAVSGNDPRFVLMFMVFYRGFVRPIKLLNELMSRFETLASAEQQDGSIIRFALMQLTKMLGDWVQDYPGDLSGPETYPLLCSFFDRLCQHPSTTHTATLLRPYVDDVKDSPDLDAAWSKDQDSSRPKTFAADASPVRPVNPAEKPDFPTSMLRGPFRERSDSEISDARSNTSARSEAALLGPAPPSQLSALVSGEANRARSASDATTFSGLNGEGSPRGQSSASLAGIAPSVTDSARSDGSAGLSMDAHQQKLSLRSVSQTLENTDDHTIAAELTRLEWDLFIAISPRDLLRHILVPRIVRGNEGPVARSIIHFNYISFWVCSMILVQQKVKNRARMLEKFMNIASILRHSNNYNTLQALLAGLNNASIHRLRSTREAMAGKSVSKVYQSLTRLMSSDRSFAAYRLALENSEGRTIPYLGVHLQDILSMSDGNPSKRASDDMVHWRKFSLMDEAVMAIVRCQREDSAGRANAAVERMIMNVPVMDEDALYQRSLTVEPRQGSGPATAGSKILKMLNNS